MKGRKREQGGGGNEAEEGEGEEGYAKEKSTCSLKINGYLTNVVSNLHD